MLLLSLLVGALTFVGCESKPAPSTPTPAPPATPAVDASPDKPETKSEPSAPTVTLDIKNWDETLELVAQHKGKVVMLDVWSTSCTPCMDEFPHLVELHKKHGEKLVCMSASCDYVGIKSKPPESYRDGVLEFLTKQNATFQNVLLNVDADTLFAKIDLASIPAVYVFGTDGKVAKRFDNDNAKAGEEFTYTKDVVPFVEKLLEGTKNEERGTEN
jgi:thiol-disulfide isomerase/thioredoxin